MYDLILYDTSNFVDFPIGGQLTSIRNFLRYIAEFQTEIASQILLVGITSMEEEVGIRKKVEIDGVSIDFLPVLYRDTDLSNVQSSMRIAYLKALMRNAKKIPSHRKTVHYIHTPEAYIAIKTRHLFARTVVFSHGSFFNMVDGFRFFRKNKLVHILFNWFIVALIKSANMIFTLDSDSELQYRKYTSRVYRVENSICLPACIPDRGSYHNPIRLLFVGRLSKVKRVDEIIRAAGEMKDWAHLTIIGDGEERAALESLIAEKKLEGTVTILGALMPKAVGTHMCEHDILIMNSILEGKPMTILEAMSYGLPVVTTPVGGIPEVVTDRVSGMFTYGTKDEIKNAVRHICSDYQIYSKNAQKTSEKYDYRIINGMIFKEIMKLR